MEIETQYQVNKPPTSQDASSTPCEFCSADLAVTEYTFGNRTARIPAQCDCAGATSARRAIVEPAPAITHDRLTALGLVGRLSRATFDTFTMRDGWKDGATIKAQCMQYAANPRGWLVMSGGYGSGKSHLAAAIVREMLECGGFGRFEVWTDTLEQIKLSWDRHDGETARINKRLQTRGVLVLDDVDKKKPTEWSRERLFDVVNYRYNAELPLVITTNTPPERLGDIVGGAVMDRLIGEAQWLRFDVASYRGN